MSAGLVATDQSNVRKKPAQRTLFASVVRDLTGTGSDKMCWSHQATITIVPQLLSFLPSPSNYHTSVLMNFIWLLALG